MKWFDLAAFDDKVSIPCNFFPFHSDFDLLHVEHLLITEPWFFYPIQMLNNSHPYGKFVKNPYQRAYRDIINKYRDKEFFVSLSNYPALRQKNITYLFRDIYDDRLPDNYITRRINAFAGSLRVSVLLAIYMGFEHCYLVGHDYTHVPSRSLHFYEKGQGVFHSQENFNKDFFNIAKEFIDITTITLDGGSDFVNAVTYREHTGRVPVFRENTEIVNKKYLDVLANWPGYSIY